jgi:2-oxoglutarate ferredoxin oxidoreductase subunit alpha
VQEAIDLTVLAFDLADQYRWPVVILADGNIGQIMEPAELPPMRQLPPAPVRPAWALTGKNGRSQRNVITSIHLDPHDEEAFNRKIQAKMAEIRKAEMRWVERHLEEAEIIVVAFGTAGRVADSAVRAARAEGLRVGLIRPVSLFPFPEEPISRLADEARAFLVVEMNAGQMVEDVRLAVGGQAPVRFYGRMGGVVPLPEEVLEQIRLLHADRSRKPT